MCRWMPSLLTVLAMPLAAAAQDQEESQAPPARLPNQAHAVAHRPAHHHGEMYRPLPGSPAGRPPVQPGYPYLNAPLNPTPQPNVPVQVGSTMVTNQAFYPQEMLYPHDYMALYPPYYYRAKGWWLNTPFGPRSHEKWELLGTRVKVKYRSEIPFWTGFHAPHRKFFDSDENWSNPSASKMPGDWFN